jgi:histidinol-phosphate aminotransferase
MELLERLRLEQSAHFVGIHAANMSAACVRSQAPFPLAALAFPRRRRIVAAPMSDLWQLAHPWLRDLVSYEPGKPIEDVARELGLQPRDIIKLASNENPLGPSPKALAAMREAIERAHFYPDGGSYYLREAIAEKFGFERGNVILGCGSNEVIEFIGKAFLNPGDDIIAARHAFVVYKLMATLFGARTIETPDPGFAHDLDAMLAAITPRTKEIFIANPNNPTGTLLSQAEIDRFMARVPEHVIVVFDEAYYEFLPDPPDTLKYVRAGRDVVVLRTFSKIQGLASLRVGYGLARRELIDVLQKTRQPFNSNGIAQAAALAGLRDDEHQQKTRELTWQGRDFMQREFAAMGLEFVPSHANFVLVKVGDGKAIFNALMKRGVIVRDMNAYGLPEWIRVSIGTMPQNERFLAELKTHLQGNP